MTTLAAPTRLSRRHGEQLMEAIHAATLAELAETGYDRLSIEAVAERAHTGKASIYRRWPNKLELVIATIDRCIPMFDSVADTGDLRTDLLRTLGTLAEQMSSQVGDAMRGCMVDLKSHAELHDAIHERLVLPRLRLLGEVFDHAVQRGEVHPSVVTDRVLELGPALLYAELSRHAGTIPAEAVTGIVDEVMLPLLHARAVPAG